MSRCKGLVKPKEGQFGKTTKTVQTLWSIPDGSASILLKLRKLMSAGATEQCAIQFLKLSEISQFEYLHTRLMPSEFGHKMFIAFLSYLKV
jgi:hypothetical protein